MSIEICQYLIGWNQNYELRDIWKLDACRVCVVVVIIKNDSLPRRCITKKTSETKKSHMRRNVTWAESIHMNRDLSEIKSDMT